jgi:NAD/NADP transhydrogenase alpha subunit
MFSRNIVTLLGEFVGKDGSVTLDFANDVVGPSTVTHAGEVVNERVRQTLTS